MPILSNEAMARQWMHSLISHVYLHVILNVRKHLTPSLYIGCFRCCFNRQSSAALSVKHLVDWQHPALTHFACLDLTSLPKSVSALFQVCACIVQDFRRDLGA